ncbi:MAG: hypothetical protein Pg6C_02030 [Treponemataceae bacterium]|nr:MAG: hypothetical protein Pg6C_02030 [Treponemataceae bacterium]
MIFLRGIPVLCALLFVSCIGSASKEIEANFASIMTAARENDRATLFLYAPFVAELSSEEQDAVIDLFKQIAAEPKTLKAVHGGTRIKNLTVTLSEKERVFTFAFEKQGGVWALTRNIKLGQR